MKLLAKRLSQSQKDNSFEKIFVLMILLIIGFLYFSDTLNYWFLYDDPAAMVSSTESLKKIFIENRYSYAFYTPLVALSFKPDVILFGINPMPYHIHNVILLVLIAFMGYQILRLYTDRISAFSAAIIILIATPSLVCVIWITLRQYLYAMFFSLTALYIYLKHKPTLKHNKLAVLLILVLCELSFMGKEQFMALPFVLFILSEGSFKQKIYKTYPYFLLLLMHFLLRWSILGSTGGYLGIHYAPKVYIRTTFESILIASKVLFGFTWVVILIILPLILKPKKAILSALLWLASLSISFLTMFFYPSTDQYRYWFIPMILFSFMIGFNASIIRNILLKTLFLLTIMTFFLNNSLKINKDLKVLLKKETLVAKQVSESLIDSKYHNSIILFPDNRYIVESSYIYHMARVYHKISRVETYPAFYPIELLVFYPEIIKDFKDIYEIKGNDIIDITSSINGRINFYKATVSNEKPEIKLLTGDKEIEITLKCRSGKSIIVYSIKRVANKYYALKDFLPYLERINLKPFIKDRAVELLPTENLFYHKKTWCIGEKPIADNALFMFGSCVDNNGENTHLSDMLYILNPKM